MSAYLPFSDDEYKMSLGLNVIDERNWLEVSDSIDQDRQLSEKERLFALSPNKVFRAEDRAFEASLETLLLVISFLRINHPSLYARGRELDLTLELDTNGWKGYFLTHPDTHPLAIASRLVTEDLLLIRPGNQKSQNYDDSAWRLTAGFLAFPAGWSLDEAMGEPTIGIHKRVPGYEESLNNQVDKLFYSLKPERIVERLNWSLTRHEELFRHHGKFETAAVSDINKRNAGRKIWLRVERQTFRRLERTGLVVFGIRTHMTRLESAITSSADAKRLIAAIEQLPEAVAQYKSMGLFREPCLAWLAAV